MKIPTYHTLRALFCLKQRIPILMSAMLAILVGTPAVRAAAITKETTGTDLTAGASWVGGAVPGATDVATWSGSALGSGLTLGTGLSWQGIAVSGAATDIGITGAGTLTLGSSGIDLSAATQNLTISSGLTLAANNQTWTVATGRTLTHNTGTFSRSAGATLLVDKSTVTGTVTAGPTLVNSVVPWAVIKSSGTAANNSANGHTFATVSGGNIVAYTTATTVTTGYPANAATVNYDWSATGTQGQIGSSRSANTIRFTGTAAVLQQVNSTQTETMNGLMNAGGGTVTLGGGAQTMNIQAGSANELVLAAMTSGIIINGPIINTSGGVTIVGPNTVTFGGANSYTGPTRVNSGTLKLGAANRLPDGGTVTVNGTLDMATFSDTIGGLDGSGTVDNSAAGTPTLTVSSAASTTFSGLITDTAGTLALVKRGSGTLTLSGANNTFSGTTTIGGAADAAVLRASATQALGSGTIITDTTGNASTARLELSGGISLNNNVTFSGRNNSSVGIQSISGNNALSGTITYGSGGSSYTIQSDADTLTLGTASATAIGGSGTRNLFLQGAGNGNVAGNIIYASSLTKSGAGTWTLSGANTYAGNTIVSQGTLALSGSATLANTPNISVASSATFDVSALSSAFSLGGSQTLQGNGTVNGNLATASGASIIPGTSPGTLTFDDNLNLSAGGSATFELSTTYNSGNDQIVVNGALTLSSSDVINIDALSDATDLDTAGDYVLFACASAPTMATTPVLNWLGTPPGNYLNYSLAVVGNNVVLQYSSATAPTIASASADPSSAVRNQSVTITAEATPGSNPNVTNLTVDLSQIGGSATASLVLSNGNVWTNTFIVAAGTTTGSKNLAVTATDETPLTSPIYNLSLTVAAGNKTWDGGSSADDNLSSNDNWTGDIGPGLVGDGVTFAGVTRLTPNLDANYSVTSITFDGSAGSFTLGTSGSTLTNGSGGIVNNSVNPQTLNVPVVLSASQTLNAASGDLSLGGSVAYGSTTLTVAGVSNATFTSSVSGTGDFNKPGAGTLTFGATASAGQFNLDNGVVNVTGSMTATGGGSRIRVGNGAGNNGSLNVPIGATATANWSLVAGSDTSTGVINVNGGTLVHQGGLNIYVGSGGSGSTGILNLNSGTISNLVGGVIIGEGGSSVGVYNQSGGLGLLGGDVIVGQTANTNQFKLSGGTASAANLFIASGSGSGAAALSAGTLTVGGVRVAAGTAPSSVGTGSLTVSGSAVLNVTNGLQVAFAGNASKSGALTNDGGTINITGGGMEVSTWDNLNGLVIQNAGSLNLQNNLSIVFAAQNNSGTSSFLHNGGDVTFYSDAGVTVGGTGSLNLGGGGTGTFTYALNGGTLTVPQVRKVSASTGTFNFNGGTLKPAASSTTFLQGLTAANVQSGGAIIDTDGKNITVNQALLDGGGGGGLTKNGAGALYLNGASTYTGLTTVSNGTLGGTGSLAGGLDVVSGATLAAGNSIGTFTVAGASTLSGTVVAEIAAGPSADKVVFTGGATIGGTLTVTANGALVAGQTFDLFDGSLSGTFSTLNLPGGLSHWNTANLYSTGEITFVNNAPAAANFDLGVAVGGSVTATVIGKFAPALDADSEAVTIIAVSTPTSGTATIVGGTNITYTSTATAGSDSFNYTVSDGLESVTRTVSVTISSPEGFNKLSGPTGTGPYSFSYLGIPNEDYALDESPNLVAPYTWYPVVTNTASGTGAIEYNGVTLSYPSGSFRTRHVP